MAGFLGMRGSGDFTVDGQRPKNWREMILYLYPNGSAPLTAILSKMASESVDDPEFNWFTKTLSQQAGTITGIYTDAGLSSAYGGGTAEAGDTLYVKMSAADLGEFRIGHQVILREVNGVDVDKNAKVMGRVENGASSYLTLLLLEDDNTSGLDISDATRCLVVGNLNEEGAIMPAAISYDPVKVYNKTQIFRTPLDITRTAKRTRLRTGDAYKEMKREALEYHSIEMEKAFLWGVMTERLGAESKPERTTMGLIPCIKQYAAANVMDFRAWSTSNMAGASWMETTNNELTGEVFLDTYLEQLFRYGNKSKLALCGSGALLGINRLVKAKGNYEFKSTTKDYGIQVVSWKTAFGTIECILHPLFSFEPSNRNSMVIYEPANMKFRYIDDTTFYADGEKQNTGHTRRDGTKEEFLTEAGLEFHHPIGWGFLNGIGLDPA